MPRIKTWSEFYHSPRSLPEMLRWATTHSPLVAEIAKHASLLEVGTGTGMLSTIASKFAPRVVTVDNNATVLGNARTFMDTVRADVLMVRGDAFRLPFADGCFEACFSQGLLEHFADPEVELLISEQLRVAQVVYVSVPSAFYPHIGRWGPGLIGNERLMTLSRWRQILSRWRVRAGYYADFKIASFAGRTLPWPAQILLRVSPK